jgi:orotidine-5'-phosphate decarboxylase
MTRQALVDQIMLKKSFLCVGLDTDPAKIPAHLLSLPDPVFEFNKAIIDATLGTCVAYKINTAFYEAQGLAGWESMRKTVEHIPATHFRIADAKRGDIGNTSAQYAMAFFETLPFDAITVNPYMGRDSVMPFLNYEGKWSILLALTSNPGAEDFETLEAGGDALFEQVIRKSTAWGNPDQIMYVVGATRSESLDRIRKLAPDHFFLIPGVGAQGGDLDAIAQKAITKDIGILVNVSRDIIYSSNASNFAEAASAAARRYQAAMIKYL